MAFPSLLDGAKATADEPKKKKWIKPDTNSDNLDSRLSENNKKSHSPKEARKAMYGKD